MSSQYYVFIRNIVFKSLLAEATTVRMGRAVLDHLKLKFG